MENNEDHEHIAASLKELLDRTKVVQQGETPETVKAKYGLTEEQWNAIPNQPAEGSDYWDGVRICKAK